ncbi:MAG: hypothetical protein LBP59_17645 [Planctomycetaceae bacterium]|nr:hypothetical protein [Planctomycetaceae bacterium]
MSEVLISTALSVAYRQHAGETPAIRWSRLYFRIAGVSPESGCTQPLMSEVLISTALSVALRQHAGDTVAFLKFFVIKIVLLVPHVPLVPKKLLKRNLINKFS